MYIQRKIRADSILSLDGAPDRVTNTKQIGLNLNWNPAWVAERPSRFSVPVHYVEQSSFEKPISSHDGWQVPVCLGGVFSETQVHW